MRFVRAALPPFARPVAPLLASLLMALAGVGAAGCVCATSAHAAAVPGLVIGVRPSAARLQPTTPVTLLARPSVRLVAARGEGEGAQLQLLGHGGALRVTARIDGLDLPATVYEERPLVVRRASPKGRRGTYLDPLLVTGARPLLVRARAATVVWVDVQVPRDARPGLHRGTVVLTSGRRAWRVPVRVTVGQALLPVQPRLASSIGLDETQLERFERPAADAASRFAVRDRYNAMLAAMRLSVGDPHTPVSIGGDPAAFARSADAARLQQQLDRPGVRGARINLYATFPYRDPLGTDRARTVLYLRNAAAWYRAHGWFDESYVYVVDEPGEADVAKVQRWGALVHEADPALRMLVTHAPSGSYRDLPGVDVWATNVSARVDPADIARVHAQGKQYWWYPAISSYAPFPTLFVDDLRPGPRMLGWLADRYGVDGLLYYSATHWHEVADPWTTAGTWHNPDGALGNGDGVLLYPGRGHGITGPAPSVRLLQLRDGVEDDDLLAIARARDGAAPVAALEATMARSLTDWSGDPAAIEQAHARLVQGVQ